MLSDNLNNFCYGIFQFGFDILRSENTVCVLSLMAQYLHVASVISVSEDVALNVSQRRSPGQNSRLQRHIQSLQVLRGINVCWSV